LILNAPLHSPPLEGCLQGGVVNKDVVNKYVVNKQTTHILTKQTTQEANKTLVLATINNQIIFRNFVVNLPYNPKLKPLLKEKRNAGILSEVLFWQQVHKNKFHKIDFDRQRIIGNYIVDFYVKTLGLVVEIDGSSHDDKQDYDRVRQHYLESLGLKVFRITNADVKKNIERAMKDLETYIVEQYGEGSVYEPPRTAGTLPKEGNFPQGVTPNNDYLQDVTNNNDYLKDKTKKQVGKVYINDTQYFDNVPQIAWEFCSGGYQPAQKWLKDRKEIELSFDDISHYQKIIVALSETDRLIKEIDNIVIE
jgi:very-short-patch-repair endonuclease